MCRRYTKQVSAIYDKSVGDIRSDVSAIYEAIHRQKKVVGDIRFLSKTSPLEQFKLAIIPRNHLPPPKTHKTPPKPHISGALGTFHSRKTSVIYDTDPKTSVIYEHPSRLRTGNVPPMAIPYRGCLRKVIPCASLDLTSPTLNISY